MLMTKLGVVHEVAPENQNKYLVHGWRPVAEPIKAEEDIIRLKPTVKTRNTAKIRDDITTQGDE